MRQQNAARLLHDTRSTIYEATKMLLPAGQGKVNVTESRSRCGGLLTECRWNGKYHGPRTTGVLTNRAPPLSGRWKRSLCLMPRSRRGGSRGAGSPPPASPPRASRRSAPPPCSGFTGAPGHSRRTARGTSCRLVHQIQFSSSSRRFHRTQSLRVPFHPGCPFILIPLALPRALLKLGS